MSLAEYYGEFSLGFFRVGFDRREYKFTGGRGNGLWENLSGLSAGTGYFRRISEKNSLSVFLSARAGFEEDLSSSAFSFSPMALWKFSFPGGRAFFLGARMMRHRVYTAVHPVAGFSAGSPDEPGFSLTLSHPSEARYRFHPSASLNFLLEPDSRIYRLSEEAGPAPGGYLRTHDWKAGAELELNRGDNFGFNFGVMRNFERVLRLYGPDGTRIPFRGPGDAWSFYAGVSFVF